MSLYMQQGKLFILVVGLVGLEVEIFAGHVFSKNFQEGFNQGFGMIFNVWQQSVGKKLDIPGYVITEADHEDVCCKKKLQNMRKAKSLAAYEGYDLDFVIHKSLFPHDELILKVKKRELYSNYSHELRESIHKLECAQAIKDGMPELELTPDVACQQRRQVKKMKQEQRRIAKEIAKYYEFYHRSPFPDKQIKS